MQTLEALGILKTRLAAIDQEHDAEFAVQDAEREAIDAKAEAQALSAIFDLPIHCFAFLGAHGCLELRFGSQQSGGA